MDSGWINSKTNGFSFKKLEAGENTTISFSVTGRATVLLMGNDNGGRSWLALIRIVNNLDHVYLTVLKDDEDQSYNPTATINNGLVTVMVGTWATVIAIATRALN